MIEHKPELWPPDGDRPRTWGAVLLGPAAADTQVIVRHFAILEPDEDLTEYPKTLQMSWQEWTEHHADYGLNLDGTPSE